MTEQEIVRALKWLSKVRTYCDAHMVNCRECEFHGFCTDPDSDESIGQQAECMKQAASLIETLQAQHTQAALNYQQKCRDVAELEKQLAASQRRADAAVEDLYKACRGSPCNNGICVKKNCTGNRIPCEFEWRGLEDTEMVEEGAENERD